MRRTTAADRLPPRMVLDGLLITGRGVHVSGPMGQVVIRHSTLVPGWTLEPECHPVQPEEPSLMLENTSVCVQVERTILGTILVVGNVRRPTVVATSGLRVVPHT